MQLLELSENYTPEVSEYKVSAGSFNVPGKYLGILLLLSMLLHDRPCLLLSILGGKDCEL